MPHLRFSVDRTPQPSSSDPADLSTTAAVGVIYLGRAPSGGRSPRPSRLSSAIGALPMTTRDRPDDMTSRTHDPECLTALQSMVAATIIAESLMDASGQSCGANIQSGYLIEG